MAGEWPRVAFADAPVEIIDGDRGKNYPKQADFLESGYCLFLNTGNVTTDGFDFSRCQFIAREKDKALRKGKIERHDLVMTTRGTVGNVAYYNDRIAFDYIRINSGMVIFRPDPQQVEPLYLYQFLRSSVFKSQVAALRTGSAQPQLPIRDINRIKLSIPPLAEQQAIAHILGTLDDKIELNRCMNETLEAMARAIFKSWFVDFDPVRAKALGAPGASPANAMLAHGDPSLAPHIADLFPDAFEASELGEIPKGWRDGTVGEGFNITMGQSPPGETYNEDGDGLPFYQGRRDFGFRYPSIRVCCTAPTRFAKPGDTLVSVRAPVGDTNMAVEDCCVGRGVAAVRHKTGSRSYTYYAMKSLKALFDRFEAEGTVFGSINKRDFHNLPFVTPSTEVVETFEHQVFPIDQLIEINEKQTQTLAALRDTLLPKLISGELRVPDAERIVVRCME